MIWKNKQKFQAIKQVFNKLQPSTIIEKYNTVWKEKITNVNIISKIESLFFTRIRKIIKNGMYKSWPNSIIELLSAIEDG